ncbi:MATE family efflux transporter [Dethiothermospora halolimnae]|uniref:MATE family efflux transporter n=1 Tax=Dethiothermospora halolimnae TaxID=3114390 RepID=UPI003CCBE7CB
MSFLKKRDLILNGNMYKVIVTLALPIMLNNFMQTVYNLTDTFFVSTIGDDAVAAMTLVWPVIFFMMSIGMGVSIAGTALISQYTGSDRLDDATDIAGQVVSFSFVFSLTLGIIGFFLAPSIVNWMGAEGDVYRYGVNFLSIMFLGLPTMFIFFAFQSIKQGQGDTFTPMLYGGASVILNIGLDALFIMVLGFGIRGAAIATVTARGIFSFIAIYRLFSPSGGIQLTRRHLNINPRVLRKLIKVGLPASIGQSTAAFGFIILNKFIISFGDSTMTAFGIGNRINSLILMPAMGIGNALATIVGQNLGADNVPRAKSAIKKSAILSTIVLALGGATIFMIADSVVGLFTDSKDVLSQGIFYLKLITSAIPLMGFFQIFVGTFQGSGHTKMAMVMMAGRLWLLRIPLILIFKNFTDLGTRSVWYAMILSNFIICLIGYGMYLTGKWERKIIKKRSI